jgi:UTP--glucose-1-phosphate uridylyltransferase
MLTNISIKVWHFIPDRYIMTSEHTREPTVQFLSDRNYFGLESSQVFVFEQAMMPCFSPEGKIILETPTRIARAPDGNGGLFRALRDNNVVDDMKKRGLLVNIYTEAMFLFLGKKQITKCLNLVHYSVVPYNLRGAKSRKLVLRAKYQIFECVVASRIVYLY